MADDDTTDETPTPPIDMAALAGQLDALKASVESLKTGGGVAPAQPAPEPQRQAQPSVDPLVEHARNNLKAQGWSDKEIQDTFMNAVMPGVNAMLGPIAAAVQQTIFELQDEIKDLHLSGDVTKFPGYRELKDEMSALRDQGKKEGRFFKREELYLMARAQHPDKVPTTATDDGDANASFASRRGKVDTASSDLGSSAKASRRAAPEKNLSQMNAAEKAAWLDRYGDAPLG